MKPFKVNLDKLKKKMLEDQKRKDSDARYYKIKDGKNVVRFLPPWSEEGMYYKEFGVHYDVGANGEAITCPNATVGKKDCPVCQLVRECWRSGNPSDEALGRRIKLVRRFASNVIVPLEDKKAVKVLVYGVMIKDQLNTIMTGDPEREKDPHDFTDPEEGKNIIVMKETKKTKEGNFPRYTCDTSSRVVELTDKMMEGMHDLDKMFDSNVLSTEDITAVIEGKEVSTPTTSDEDEEDEGKTAFENARKSSKDDEDDEPEDEVDEPENKGEEDAEEEGESKGQTAAARLRAHLAKARKGR